MMTNYPSDGPWFWEVWDESPCKALKILRIALSMMTWNPRLWARFHDSRVDLLSAWWMACMACIAYEMILEELELDVEIEMVPHDY